MQRKDALLRAANEIILPSTVKLFCYDENIKKNIPLASGILLKTEEYYFLVTAAHIFTKIPKENIKNVGMMVGDDHINLGSTLFFTDVNLSETNNKVDLAICKLEADIFINSATPYKFFEVLPREYDLNLNLEGDYEIIGYPNSLTKTNPVAKKTKGIPFIYYERITAKYREKYKALFTELNFVVKYERKKIKSFDGSIVQQGPYPEGLSGCGIWNISVTTKNEIKTKLAGILIEYENDLINFTRVNLIGEALRVYFGQNIPPSKVVRIKSKPQA